MQSVRVANHYTWLLPDCVPNTLAHLLFLPVLTSAVQPIVTPATIPIPPSQLQHSVVNSANFLPPQVVFAIGPVVSATTATL